MNDRVRMRGIRQNVRSLNIAEPCPPHLDTGIGFESNTANLRANMLSLAIAISPYEQDGREFGLCGDVVGNGFLVLRG